MNIRHIFPLLLLLFIFQPFSETVAQEENSPEQLVAKGKEFCRNGEKSPAEFLCLRIHGPAVRR